MRCKITPSQIAAKTNKSSAMNTAEFFPDYSFINLGPYLLNEATGVLRSF